MEETFIPRKFHEKNQDMEKQKQLKKTLSLAKNGGPN